jgi:hypothetical protein
MAEQSQATNVTLYPLSLAEELRDGIQGSRLLVVPGGHGPIFGAAAADFASTAIAFLDNERA